MFFRTLRGVPDDLAWSAPYSARTVADELTRWRAVVGGIRAPEGVLKSIATLGFVNVLFWVSGDYDGWSDFAVANAAAPIILAIVLQLERPLVQRAMNAFAMIAAAIRRRRGHRRRISDPVRARRLEPRRTACGLGGDGDRAIVGGLGSSRIRACGRSRVLRRGEGVCRGIEGRSDESAQFDLMASDTLAGVPPILRRASHLRPCSRHLGQVVAQR